MSIFVCVVGMKQKNLLWSVLMASVGVSMHVFLSPVHAQAPDLPELPPLPSVSAVVNDKDEVVPPKPALPNPTPPAPPVVEPALPEMPTLPQMPKVDVPPVSAPVTPPAVVEKKEEPVVVEKKQEKKPVKKKKNKKTEKKSKRYVPPVAEVTDNSAHSLAGQSAPVQGRVSGFCDITPSIAVERAPSDASVVRSGKLSKPAGKSAYAAGDLLLITGHVYDANCVPLRDAKIDIWQMDDSGFYAAPNAEKFANPAPLFAGSGRAVSNNMGAYSFVSVLPNLSGSAAPYVNVRVRHPRVKTFVTRMYFAGDVRNETVPALTRMSTVMRSLLEADLKPWVSPEGDQGQRAVFDITVRGVDPYAKY